MAMDSMRQRLAKWRMVFAGWQLGTRPKGDPESDAVRDHREVTMLMRSEINGITRVLLEKKIVTEEELQSVFEGEALWLSESYEKKFPGFKATDNGMSIDTAVAAETMKGWRL